MRDDAGSVAPNVGALLAGLFLFGVGAFLPLALMITGKARISLGTVVGVAVVGVFAAWIPKRLVLSDEGVMLLSVFGRRRRLDTPGQRHWWGAFVPWRDFASVTRKKNNHRYWWRVRLGERRYVIRLRWHGSYEVHERMPAYRPFERLARKHVSEKIKDASLRWWSWLQ
ncbi:MAG TPA: hypothetical protein DFS52_09145 [Myxococcales bacterium]|nr:hypothetical protein [Myxococcales bacterium]